MTKNFRSVAVTVKGEVDPASLGVVMTHEHLSCDISVRSGNPDNYMRDVALIAAELGHYRAAGGGAVFEVTPIDLGSDPVALRRIAELSGVHIVHGVSFYQEADYPDWVRNSGAGEVAAFFSQRILEGVDGVRAGLIGELGSHSEPHGDASRYRLTALERKVFEAAAQTQRATGVAISTHASLGRPGHAQLEVLAEAGADLQRVVIGHCDTLTHDDEHFDLDYYLPILQRGAYVQFDLIGWNQEWPGIATDDIRARRLAALVRMGYGRQLTMSSDTCRLSQLRARGGRGYDHVLREFLPRLRAEGIPESQIDQILRDNPQRIAQLAPKENTP